MLAQSYTATELIKSRGNWDGVAYLAQRVLRKERSSEWMVGLILVHVISLDKTDRLLA